MALNNNDRNALIDLFWLSALGEGQPAAIGSQMRAAKTNPLTSAVDWEAGLRARAAIWQPFLDSGLSISAWCDEVVRYSNL